MIARIQERRLLEMLAVFPVVAVVGPRQVGKSTLVQLPRIGVGRAYCTLDDVDVLGLAQRDPLGLLNRSALVTVDEAQRRSELLRFIKSEVDRNRVAGRFLVTGSTNLNFTAELASELAGRVGLLPVSPVSWRELNGRLEAPAWLRWLDAASLSDIEATAETVAPGITAEEALFMGGYPSVVTAAQASFRSDWFTAYRQTYLERDVRQVANIGNLVDFARLFQTVAARSGQLMNNAALSRDVGIPATTVARYLSVLEATFQTVRLTPWFANIGKRLVKTPRLHWADTGMLAHLLGVRTWEDASAQGVAGSLFEAFVVNEVRKHAEVFDADARLYFVRSHGGLEVDLLVERGLRQLPIELKAATTVRGEDAGALEQYLDLTGIAKVGVVLYRGAQYRRLSRRVLAVPVTALLA